MIKKIRNRFHFEYRLPIYYVAVGTLWILFSDRLVLYLTSDPEKIEIISIYKGWFYVVVTGILLFLLIRRESSKQKILYKQLEIANHKAQESDRLKTAFLANISHYIRTPMNSILGFVELLHERDLDYHRRARFMSIIDEQCQVLLQLINNIIEISKIQEGQIVINNQEFSINALLKKLYLSNQEVLSKIKPGVAISYIPGLEDTSDMLYSDYSKLHLIFSNLLNNAIKFTSNGGIEFGYVIHQGMIECYVKDTGKGIPPDKSKGLSSRFMQTNHTLQEVNEGIGLGLYLSSGLTNALGGNLWIDYTSTNGTKFMFTLPYTQKPE